MPKIPIFAAKPSAALERPSAIPAFLTRWSASGAAERANAQSFITELCTLLGLEPPRPKTPDESANAYVFEKTIPGGSSSKNFIDCYKRGHFVLESKQGADALHTAAPLSMAVAAAYGWPADLPEGEILERLVQLNARRAAEEAAGQVRWLRPEYQAPGAGQPGTQGKLIEAEAPPVVAPGVVVKRAWPDQLPAQAAALRDLLAALDSPVEVSQLAAAFEGKAPPKRKADIQRLLETMAALGQAEEVRAGQWKR